MNIPFITDTQYHYMPTKYSSAERADRVFQIPFEPFTEYIYCTLKSVNIVLKVLIHIYICISKYTKIKHIFEMIFV